MAIKAVRDNFVKMLNSKSSGGTGAKAALRNHAGNVFQHTMYVKTSDMKRLLLTELNRVLTEENSARAAMFSDAMSDATGGYNIFGDDSFYDDVGEYIGNGGQGKQPLFVKKPGKYSLIFERNTNKRSGVIEIGA